MKQDIQGIMRQAQKMQGQIAKVQESFADKQVEASTGGGMVTVVVNGKQELIAIKINPEVVSAEDVGLLEDMILGAVNQALKNAEAMVNSEIQKITGGLNIPGLF